MFLKFCRGWSSTQFNQICYVKTRVLIRIHYESTTLGISWNMQTIWSDPLTSGISFFSIWRSFYFIFFANRRYDFMLGGDNYSLKFRIQGHICHWSFPCWINKFTFNKVIKIAYVTDLERRVTYISNYRNLVQNVIKNLMGIFSVSVNIIFKQVGFFSAYALSR